MNRRRYSFSPPGSLESVEFAHSAFIFTFRCGAIRRTLRLHESDVREMVAEARRQLGWQARMAQDGLLALKGERRG